MKLLARYFKRHVKIVVITVLFILIFCGVFALYRLPTEAVLYAGALCLAVGAAAFAVGFSRHISRHKRLTLLADKARFASGELIAALPEPGGTLEEDYQNIIKTLKAEMDAENARQAKTESDRRDYYTLWMHQIKTPIAAMNLLLQAYPDAESEAMRAELFKTGQYAEMALSYLRLESESTDYVIAEAKLSDLVRQAVRKYARLFVLGHTELEIEESGETVLTDEKWATFVIEQVLSNALKYTQGGKIKIYVRGKALFIEDTGIGIKAEDIPRVFEKGFTGYNGRQDKKSTGIGLYLCRRICDRLGHDIFISSKQGQGTCVTIDFSQKVSADE